MNLEHHGIITEKRGEGNVGAAGNDVKFLKSSLSSAHISFNVWTWTISSSAKQKRGEGRVRKKSSSCFGLRQFHHQQNKKEQLLPNINFDPISTHQMCCDRPKNVASAAIATQI
jgi:hypothetical protein